MRKVAGRIKLMTYQTDTCRYLVCHSALIGGGKDEFAQCLGNVTEWNTKSWCQWHDLPEGKHYKFTMSSQCHKLVPVLI